jgi:hypothetical protein
MHPLGQSVQTEITIELIESGIPAFVQPFEERRFFVFPFELTAAKLIEGWSPQGVFSFAKPGGKMSKRLFGGMA